MKLLFKSIFVLLFAAASASADGFDEQETSAAAREHKNEAQAQADRSSENFKKTEDFIPGEEVVTTTGKKARVWSTKGPVPVSKAPEPFADRDTSVLDQTHIVIDAEDVRRRRKREERVKGERGKDSFDVRSRE